MHNDVFSILMNQVFPALSAFFAKLSAFARAPTFEIIYFLKGISPIYANGFYGELYTISLPLFDDELPEIFLKIVDILSDFFSFNGLYDTPFFLAILIVFVELFFLFLLIRILIAFFNILT